MTESLSRGFIQDITYTETKLSDQGDRFAASSRLFMPRVDATHPLYRDLNAAFDVRNFRICRPPVDLGAFGVSTETLAVLRCPIKYPGSDYRVPAELTAFVPLIRWIAQYECAINPMHARLFSHVTAHAAVVERGQTLRYPGWHGDGLQGAKRLKSTRIEHSYVLTTEAPIEFCLQPFFVDHLDPAKYNLFLEFDRQVRPANVFPGLADHLYLIDPYMVHQSPPQPMSRARLFFRMTFAHAELEHPNNTVNPMFPKRRYPARFEVRALVAPPDVPVPYGQYGLCPP